MPSLCTCQIRSMDFEQFDDMRLAELHRLRLIAEELSSVFGEALDPPQRILPLAMSKVHLLDHLGDHLTMMRGHGYLSREDYHADLPVLMALAERALFELFLHSEFRKGATKTAKKTKRLNKVLEEKLVLALSVFHQQRQEELEEYGECAPGSSQLRLYAGGSPVHVFHFD